MIDFAPRAARQVEDLRQHYEDLDRPEAVRGLITALESAWQIITTNKSGGLAAPRPYPHLARPGWAWVKAGRYWVSYAESPRPVILAVFYDMANIPKRI